MKMGQYQQVRPPSGGQEIGAQVLPVLPGIDDDGPPPVLQNGAVRAANVHLGVADSPVDGQKMARAAQDEGGPQQGQPLPPPKQAVGGIEPQKKNRKRDQRPGEGRGVYKRPRQGRRPADRPEHPPGKKAH